MQNLNKEEKENTEEKIDIKTLYFMRELISNIRDSYVSKLNLRHKSVYGKGFEDGADNAFVVVLTMIDIQIKEHGNTDEIPF